MINQIRKGASGKIITDAQIDMMIEKIQIISLDKLIQAYNILAPSERMGLNPSKDSEFFQAIDKELKRRK